MGDGVGFLVGLREGLSVGEIDGDAVGFSVGLEEGMPL